VYPIFLGKRKTASADGSIEFCPQLNGPSSDLLLVASQQAPECDFNLGCGESHKEKGASTSVTSDVTMQCGAL